MPTYDPTGIVAAVKEVERRFDREIALIYGRAPRDDTAFHLAPCGRCRAPVWKQSCPVCDFYPMGSMDNGVHMNNYNRATGEFTPTEKWRPIAERYRAKARETYDRHMTQHGNMAAWWLAENRKTVAYKENARYREALERLYVEAQAMTGLASADAIWDAHGPEGKSSSQW